MTSTKLELFKPKISLKLTIQYKNKQKMPYNNHYKAKLD